MKKIIILMLFLSIFVLSFAKLNNVYIGYNNIVYSTLESSLNTNELYIGYNFGNIPLKIQAGGSTNLQSFIMVMSYLNFNDFYINPYLKYRKNFSLGFLAEFKNFGINYNISKNFVQTVGFNISFPIIKFGKDVASSIICPNSINSIAGKDIKLRIKLKNDFYPAENVDVFYNIDNNKTVYAGKTNNNGEIIINTPILKKAGNHIINIYANNINNIMKKINVYVKPNLPQKISILFDKDYIYTSNQNILKIKEIKIFDDYSNIIKNYNLKFIDFKLIGDYKDIKYSYLDGIITLDPIEKPGIYKLYYEAIVNNTLLSGITDITVKNNPKDITNVKTSISYIGTEKNYAVFKISNPKIIFSNLSEEYAENYYLYFDNQKIKIDNNKFKLPLNNNFEKKYNFKVIVYYQNFIKTLDLTVSTE